MLTINKLNKSYNNKQILFDINFNVNKGEIFGIIGRSGAGKSTLLRCLNLLDTPSSGSIVVNNIDVMTIENKQLRQLRQKIGVIFQNFSLLDSKNIIDNIALPLKIKGGFTHKQILEKVEQVLELVELTEHKYKYPKELSGGQKQRVGIARALINDPILLLCDEATSALDTYTTNNILQLLYNINQKLNLTIIMITHQIEVVRKLCDRVMVLDNGHILEQGKIHDVLLHPKAELTRKLVLKEEVDKYLEEVMPFYKFHKTPNTHLLVITYIGQKVFEPILSNLTKNYNLEYSILRGELGRFKNMPFGQLLLEINGELSQLNKAFKYLTSEDIHYEVIQ
jgi:D-methionine transport system ATP-binding protein